MSSATKIHLGLIEEEEETGGPLLPPLPPPTTPLLPTVTRLSQLAGGAQWQQKGNGWGEKPAIDFAFSAPFR